MFDSRLFKTATYRTVEPALREAFDSRQISAMADLGTVVHVSSGDDMITEGTSGSHAYFITVGSASVVRDGERVATLGAGDLVGERALVTGQARNATVTALMPITALRFDREQFELLRSELAAVRSLSDQLIAARS